MKNDIDQMFWVFLASFTVVITLDLVGRSAETQLALHIIHANIKAPAAGRAASLLGGTGPRASICGSSDDGD